MYAFHSAHLTGLSGFDGRKQVNVFCAPYGMMYGFSKTTDDLHGS